MSNPDSARRIVPQIFLQGVNVSQSLRPYLLSVTYTDNETDAADDLQIKLQDRDGLWLEQWLSDALENSGNGGFSVQAVLVQENWIGDGKDRVLDCGTYELDSVDISGPPNTVTLKATSLPYSAQIRQTEKTKAWESCSLSGIASEIAAANGMTCLFLSDNDPFYQRAEQFQQSDIALLSDLCREAGISLKATSKLLVLFDQMDYEQKPTVWTIQRNSGYLKHKLSVGQAGTQYASCRVSYTNPGTGKRIEATAKVEDYHEQSKNNQQLEITAKVSSVGEAKSKAEKYLRLYNKYAKTASFTIPGNLDMAAGITVMLSGWGAWNGKYIVERAVHTVGASGCTTQIELRKTLEGY